jgi:uncharacterized membrane protein YcaP (DUF421 family)
MIQQIWSNPVGVFTQSGGGAQFWSIILQAAIVYSATLLMVRIGEKRFLGKSTAFDVIIGMILGAMMSRAINGTAPILPTLAAGVTLVGLHWTFAAIALRSDRFNKLLKGKSRLLVMDGEIQWKGMREGLINMGDLLEALRLGGETTTIEDVKEARLERNGAISVIPKENKPQVFEVSVAEGVQTIRIEIE